MTILVETRYGTMECIEGDSIVSKALMLYGEWAQLELDVVARMVRPGDTVLDVGAFLGTHTLAFAHMVGNAGSVHSFEPRQAIRQILSSNVERNDLVQVRVHACALGSVPSEVDVRALDTETPQNFGGLAIEGVAADESALTETLSIRRVDDFTFERLDFIKIDVEGMEADVIHGGGHTLATHRPIIFAECNDLANGSKTLRSCLDMRYVVYGVLSAAFNIDNFKHLADNIFLNASEASLLAIPQEKQAVMMQRINLAAFARIDSLDAMSLLLLHKPQYVDEVLALTPAAVVLGIDSSSPLARKRNLVELQLHHAVLTETVQKRQAELGDTRGLLADVQVHRSALAESVQNLNETVQGLLAVVGSLREAITLLETYRDAHKRAHEVFARYRGTSFLHLWERLTGHRKAPPPTVKFNIDSLVLQNNRVFAYGWMFDADAKVCQARLRVSLVDGTEVSLPVFHGKERPDVAEAFPGDKYSLFSGWMIYAAWAGAAATTTALVGRLENGSEFECLMPLNTSADSATAQPVADSIGSLQHVRNGGATGQFSTEGAEVKSFAVDIIRSLLVAAQQDRCVLVIDHAMGGGANQFRRQWIAQRLRTRPFVLVLTFEIATLRYALEILTTHGSHRHLLGSDEPVTTLAESGLVDEVLYNDAVSFPRPEDLPNWLVAFKRVPGTILTLAVHDYLPVCPSQFLLNDSGRFCRIPPIEECLRCLPVNENEFASLFTSRHMPQWRKQWGAALAVADQILCFSPSSKALLVRAYPALDQSRITIEPHSIAAFDRKPVINLDAPLHIGVVGAIGIHKGASVIQGLAAEIARRAAPVRITIIGSIDLVCDPGVVKTTGAYKRADLPSLIESTGANLFVLPSICPETFSYVTQELMALDVPLVSFDFGAPAERLATYRFGRVLPRVTSVELLDGLIQFHCDLVNGAAQKFL